MGLHRTGPRPTTPLVLLEPELPFLPPDPDCTIRTMSFISLFNSDRQKTSDLILQIQKILTNLLYLKILQIDRVKQLGDKPFLFIITSVRYNWDDLCTKMTNLTLKSVCYNRVLVDNRVCYNCTNIMKN
jgi:hypothetical protein